MTGTNGTGRQLTVGRTAEGAAFRLPLGVATATSAIVGVRGSGKTTTASVIVEELLDVGYQVLIVDPTDGWWGLKSSADGKRAGYPVVVFGGPHGDVPLTEDAGAAIADLVVEERIPVILSLRHLRKKGQRRFVTDLAEQLYHRKGEAAHRTPLVFVLDEASTFVPQRVGSDEARMVGAVEDLVRRGRSAGIGVALIDQRPASVNKDVLTQLEVLVAHRITSPQDRKALREWVEQHDTEDRGAEFLLSLAALPRGCAWIWSPLLDLFERVQVRQRRTFDSSKTPEHGEEVQLPERWAKIDLAAVESRLGTAIASAKENHPKELKKRIQALEMELKRAQRAPAPAADAGEVEELRRQLAAVVGERDEAIRQIDAELEMHARHLRTWQEELGQFVTDLQRAAERPMPVCRFAWNFKTGAPASTTSTNSAPPRARAPLARPRTPPISTSPAATEKEDGPDLDGPAMRILGSLRKLEALGLPRPDRRNVAAFAGYSFKGGSFRTYLSRLSSQGLVEYPDGGAVTLTPIGRAAAPFVDPPLGLGELHAAWVEILGGPEARLLEEIIHAYPAALSRHELAERTGYSGRGGSFRTYLSRLGGLHLVRYPDAGTVVASDVLFPEGLR